MGLLKHSGISSLHCLNFLYSVSKYSAATMTLFPTAVKHCKPQKLTFLRVAIPPGWSTLDHIKVNTAMDFIDLQCRVQKSRGIYHDIKKLKTKSYFLMAWENISQFKQ